MTPDLSSPAFRILVLVGILLFPSCQSQNLFNNEEQKALTVQVADVFVEGKDRGTTPQTIRIFRGRRELSVVLKQGRTTVRTFTLEESYSPNAAELDFSFYGVNDGGDLRFTVEELPTTDDLNYVIPFYEQIFTIKDNQYGLILIIDD